MEAENTATFILIFVLVAIVAGGGYYFFNTFDLASQEQQKNIDESFNQTNRVVVESAVRNLIVSGETAYLSSMLDPNSTPLIYHFVDGEVISDSKGRITGVMPDEGIMVVNKKGEVALAVIKDGWCSTKGFSDPNASIFPNELECIHEDIQEYLD